MPRKSWQAHHVDTLQSMLCVRLATVAARQLESSSGKEDHDGWSDEDDMNAIVAGAALEETIRHCYTVNRRHRESQAYPVFQADLDSSDIETSEQRWLNAAIGCNMPLFSTLVTHSIFILHKA